MLALIAAHAIVGSFAALASDHNPTAASAFFFALMMCQTSLLGIWGGVGLTPGVLRLIGLVVGSGLLGTVLGLGLGRIAIGIYFLVYIVMSLVAGAAWLVRLTKARLVRLGSDSLPAREGLQFTIQHLLLLTLVVACLLTIGKLLAPRLWGLDLVAAVAVLGACFVAVALASLWAMLGLGRPFVRSLVVFPLAAGAGWIGEIVIRDDNFPFWIAVTLTQAVLLVASLAVVRYNGYRLAAKREEGTVA